MQGGIPQGHICLVAGASGAMKSVLLFPCYTMRYCTVKQVVFTLL